MLNIDINRDVFAMKTKKGDITADKKYVSVLITPKSTEKCQKFSILFRGRLKRSINTLAKMPHTNIK
jgi:hypothetical protein